MKAMMLTGIREMQLQDVPAPELKNDTDVLIRLAVVGVCGSDVHYYTTGRIGSMVVDFPFTLGHECSGVVEKVGSAVTRVKPGDRIAVEPAMPCFQCDQCLAGRINTCRTLRFLGCPGQAEGCLSEFLVMPETSCFPVKPQTTAAQAALAEPLTIGVYSVQQSMDLEGKDIGILGSGPIGLSVLLPAQLQGVGKTYATDKIDERLKVAADAGATWTGNPDKQDVVADILADEPAGLDVVFECCGQQDAIDQAIDLLKPGGKLMLIGIPEVDRISFVIDKMRRKEICIQNVRRQMHCVEVTLDMIESGQVSVDFMVTHRFGLEQTAEAFDLVGEYRDGVVKALIEFDTDWK